MLTTLRTDNRDVSFTIRVDYQRLLLDHLDVIDHIVQTTGRRRHLSASEQEDFAGAVRLKFIEDDYAVLRKFQHRSSLRTYLASVIERQSLDFCVQQWGRWRPSAVADRLGPVAVLLERLVTRDGHSLEEAMEMAHTNHAVLESERQLRDLWAQLPVRTRTTQVGEEAAAGVSSDQTSESNIADAEHQANITRLDRALLAAFTALPDQDRVLLALRFDQDLSIAQIAVLTGASVATLHRRVERSTAALKHTLSTLGFGRDEVAALIGHAAITLSPLLRAEVERYPWPVRLTKQDG